MIVLGLRPEIQKADFATVGPGLSGLLSNRQPLFVGGDVRRFPKPVEFLLQQASFLSAGQTGYEPRMNYFISLFSPFECNDNLDSILSSTQIFSKSPINQKRAITEFSVKRSHFFPLQLSRNVSPIQVIFKIIGGGPMARGANKLSQDSTPTII